MATKINGEKLKKAVRQSGINSTKMSKYLLNMGDGYLNDCYRRNSIGEEQLKKLCEILRKKEEDFILKEELSERQKETAPVVDDKSVDALVIGLYSICQEQKKSTELMKKMLEELHSLNSRVERIERRISTTENAVGQIAANITTLTEDKETEIKELKEIKSSSSIISGRLKDLCLNQNTGSKIKAVI